jgi:CubicO group peptidase (beta-lactamase class C family)
VGFAPRPCISTTVTVEMLSAALVFGIAGIFTTGVDPSTLPVVGGLIEQLGGRDRNREVLTVAAFTALFYTFRGALVLGEVCHQARLTEESGRQLAFRLFRGCLAMPHPPCGRCAGAPLWIERTILPHPDTAARLTEAHVCWMGVQRDPGIENSRSCLRGHTVFSRTDGDLAPWRWTYQSSGNVPRGGEIPPLAGPWFARHDRQTADPQSKTEGSRYGWSDIPEILSSPMDATGWPSSVH